MRDIQSFYILIAAVALLLVLGGTADAFWRVGDSGELNRSGLDLEQGYDRNTVVKISGPVAVPPRPLAGGLIAFDLNIPGEQIVVVLGPAWYLQNDKLDWKIGDQVTVQGSLAQGKDGRTYLLSRRVNVSDGATIELRGENGSPSWFGGLRGGQPGSGSGGQVQRGDAGARRGR